MKDENPKPSEVIYVFLQAIATIVVTICTLVTGCLWLLGGRAVKLVTGESAGAESETD